MRFCVSYKLSRLDQSYRMKVYGLIKEAVRQANSPYYEKLFVQSAKQIKPFTFSTFLHNFSLKGSFILLDQITITISSPDMEFAVHAFNGLRRIKEYRVEDEIWIQSNVNLIHEQNILNRKILFQTLSPILIEDKDGKPLSPMDSKYESELNYYSNLQVQQFAKRELLEPIRFSPVNMQKVVIKEKNRYLKKEEQLFFTTYKGTFFLEGHPEDLQLLYQLGLGKRTTYFGLLECKGEEV